MAQQGAMMATSTGPTSEPHTKQHTGATKLEDQAALAALYASKYDNTKTGKEHLDSNNKLSSASAATSLKYAKPEDLPSYPSPGLGLRKHKSAAGTAASLGWANQKSFEHWKPDPSTSASTAAMLAKDYKMAPQWQPEQSSHGAKAALLAHKNDGKVEAWRPESSSAWGNSAAAQAFKKYGAGQSSPKIDYGYTELGRKGSLMAATGAMSTSRRRADSTPQPVRKLETYPDEANAAANALSAANHAHKRKSRSNLSADAGAVPYTTMPREMYTSHPPVAPEVEEKTRQDSLHASAVAMAKQMYNIQQKHIDAASSAHRAAVSAHDRQPSPSGMSDDLTPMKYSNLQEAAKKLAQERLAKLHNEHAKNRDYRDYYGSPQQPSRLSIRGRTRRRASSDGKLDEDREQSNKIRAQMSLFSSNLNQVDAEKRQHDREALIAVAQRNVTNRLHGMDERVFRDTGKVTPSLLSEWEVKAHAAAQANSATRMENYGKVDIGGGKFIDQSAVDAVAAKNVQPILDDINDKAEKERERQAEVKLDQERQKAKAEQKKVREKEEKEINKKLKQQDKEEEKARKLEEKKAKEEEKRASKERRKSLKSETGTSTVPVATPKTTETNASPSATTETPAPTTIAERRQTSPNITNIKTSPEPTTTVPEINTPAIPTTSKSPKSPKSPPTSPSKEGGKVKNWLKNTFNRRSRKSSTSAGDHGKESGFVGGAALTGASHPGNKSNTSISARSESMRDVALASGTQGGESSKMGGLDGSTGLASSRGRKGGDSVVSSLSTPSKDDEFLEARDGFDDVLVSPRSFGGEKDKGSPAREARFHEEI